MPVLALLDLTTRLCLLGRVSLTPYISANAWRVGSAPLSDLHLAWDVDGVHCIVVIVVVVVVLRLLLLFSSI